MTQHSSETGGDKRRITRRGAIASGAAALGAGALWGTSAMARSPGANAAGDVYVFNLFNESITGVSVDGAQIGDIDGWSYGGTGRPPKYTPAGRAIPRSLNPAPGRFAIGNNRLILPWDSFTGTTTIRIPEPSATGSSLADDLILLVTHTTATLITTRGARLGTFAVDLSALGRRFVRLLAELRRTIRNSRVEKRLKSQLLSILKRVEADLDHGHNLRARRTLQRQLISLLAHNSGRHGLGARQAKSWIADIKKLIAGIPRHDGATAGDVTNGGRLCVFNMFNEPISGLIVNGESAGDISRWSTGGTGEPLKYTPTALRVPIGRYPEPGVLAYGENEISLPWESLTGQLAPIQLEQVTYRIDDDLILLITPSGALLMTERGTSQRPNPLELAVTLHS